MQKEAEAKPSESSGEGSENEDVDHDDIEFELAEVQESENVSPSHRRVRSNILAEKSEPADVAPEEEENKSD